MVVVRRDHLEPPVVAAELLDELGHLVELVDVRHDPAERTDEPIPLRGHRDREHAPQLGVGQEQVGVEEERHLVAEALRQRPRLLQFSGVHQAKSASQRSGPNTSYWMSRAGTPRSMSAERTDCMKGSGPHR